MFRIFKVCFAAIGLFVFILFTGIACNKKDALIHDALPIPADPDQAINRWILDSMLHYYLWSNGINNYPSLSLKPDQFFNTLKYTGDKFSWISNGSSIVPPVTTYNKFGFEYSVINIPTCSGTDFTGIVLLVAPGSNAANSGLKRGQLFSHVNGLPVNSSNFETIQSVLRGNTSVRLNIVTCSGNTTTGNASIFIAPGALESRPVIKTSLYSKNGYKTGFVFYNEFAEKYDKDILDAFDRFKAENVKELVIDMRYNRGGSVASVAKIAAAVMNISNPETIFSKYRGNPRFGTFSQSFTSAINTSGNQYRRNFNELATASLKLQRLFILSGANTASAAEMLINNLKPYMEVIHIGEKTSGKNYAGLTIKDQRNPQQVSWYMQPIIFELFNAQGNGAYENGINPVYEIDEDAVLPLSDTGSPNDALVKKALTLIYGSLENITINGKRHHTNETTIVQRLNQKDIIYISLQQLGAVTIIISEGDIAAFNKIDY
jgi:carboxyl-terminal processing protease